MRARFQPKQISSTTTVDANGGVIHGVFVSSGTNPTFQIYDNTSATGDPIVETVTGTAGTFYELNAAYGTGLHVVVGGTSPEMTILYRQGG